MLCSMQPHATAQVLVVRACPEEERVASSSVSLLYFLYTYIYVFVPVP